MQLDSLKAASLNSVFVAFLRLLTVESKQITGYMVYQIISIIFGRKYRRYRIGPERTR